MNIGYVLAVTNIVVATGAGVGYAIVHDWRHSLYWLAAAVLTSTVTF